MQKAAMLRTETIRITSRYVPNSAVSGAFGSIFGISAKKYRNPIIATVIPKTAKR
jgi:hypothetical protein